MTKAVCQFQNLLPRDGFMSKYKSQIMILCEDKQQQVFARSFLLGIGFHHRRLYFRICPRGKQSGEQFVRQNYPSGVRAYRSKKNHLLIGLVVMIDADNDTVEKRLQELDSSLASDSQEIRQQNGNIVIFIPKRNIETWIHYLMGKEVDEETVYTKLQKEGDCKIYINELLKSCHIHNDLEQNAPPSLHKARNELNKIKTFI